MLCSWIIRLIYFKRIYTNCALSEMYSGRLFINAQLKEQASSSAKIFSLRNLVLEELLIYLCIEARFCLCYK